MRAAAMPGTFYLISGQVGVGEYMNAPQVESLQASGSEIGSYTVSHRTSITWTPRRSPANSRTARVPLEATFGPIRRSLTTARATRR
jgi:hypothetical protein